MKKIRKMLTIAALATAIIAIQSCNNNETLKGKENNIEMPNGDMQYSYACPMHPDIKGEKGDKCSKCGMDLEEIK